MTLENVLDTLKDYTLQNLNAYLAAYDDEIAPILLTRVEEENINLFDLDPDKYRLPLMITIAPDSGDYEPITVSGYTVRSRVVVYFVFRGDKADPLMRRALRTEAAFLDMINADPTLGGGIEDITIESDDYYDAVEADINLKAVELSLIAEYEI